MMMNAFGKIINHQDDVLDCLQFILISICESRRFETYEISANATNLKDIQRVSENVQKMLKTMDEFCLSFLH